MIVGECCVASPLSSALLCTCPPTITVVGARPRRIVCVSRNRNQEGRVLVRYFHPFPSSVEHRDVRAWEGWQVRVRVCPRRSAKCSLLLLIEQHWRAGAGARCPSLFVHTVGRCGTSCAIAVGLRHVLELLERRTPSAWWRRESAAEQCTMHTTRITCATPYSGAKVVYLGRPLKPKKKK